MISLKRKNKGFTIVELLIVIVIIGILATLIIVTFTGLTQKARDTQRQTDIGALDSHIEAYYTQHGDYPTYAQLMDATFRSTNMKGLDPQALIGPKGGTLTHNADTGTGVAANDSYNYYASESTNSGAECTSANTTTDDTNCDTFVLSTKLENGGTQFVKKSN